MHSIAFFIRINLKKDAILQEIKIEKEETKFDSTFFSVQMKTQSCLCEKKVAYLALTLDTLALQIRIL